MANFEPVGVEAVVEGLQSFQRDLEKMNEGIGGINANLGNLEKQGKTNTFANMASGIANVANLALNLGKIVADVAMQVGGMAWELGKTTVDAAVDFESAFAGVIKTTDGLVDAQGNLTEVGTELQQGFRDLSKEIPTSVEDLLALGEAGGQLGIARENLLEFTTTVAAMGEATNISADEAAVAFAQMANVMGTEGSDAFSRMGSAVVELGNNFATNEKDIVNFAQRIAGAGNVAGLTEADVFAIGAAMSSVGIKAEAGGTAVQKVLLAMNQSVAEGSDQMEIFAGVAGVEAERFAELWEKDAGAAFEGFVSGLGALGDDALPVLEALGLQDQRLIAAFLSLSKAVDSTGEEGGLLAETMTRSSSAFEENIALTKEAEQRYATTESQMEVFKNTLKDIQITAGQALIPVLTNLLEIAKPLIDTFANAAAVVFGEFTRGFERTGNVFYGIGEILDNFFEEDGQIMNSFWNVVDFVQETLIPGFQNLVTWLITNIPVAIEKGSVFWNETLLPAIQAVGTWINETLVPIFTTIGEWLGQLLPIAGDELATWWNDVLLPVLGSLKELWDTALQPILADLWEWLKVVIPPAIETLAIIWETVLKPALQAIGTFLAETLIPIFTDLLVWLRENIPVAVEALSVLWQETFKPALEAVWSFIQEHLMPLFVSLNEFFIGNFNKTMEALTLIWEEGVLPALNAVWKFIDENVLPIIVKLAEYIEKTFNPILEGLRKFLDENLTKAFNGVKTAIGFVVDLVEKLTDAIAKIDVTKLIPFIGKSPSPLEKGLRGISSAMAELNANALPKFAMNMAMVGGGMVAGPQSVSNQNVNIQVGPNTIGSQIDQAVFENRVLEVVRDNI